MSYCSLQEELSKAQTARDSLKNLIKDEVSQGGSWLKPLATRLQKGLKELDSPGGKPAENDAAPQTNKEENLQEERPAPGSKVGLY